jgi:hypothetical protein
LSLSPRLVRGQVENKNDKGVDRCSFFRDENRYNVKLGRDAAMDEGMVLACGQRTIGFGAGLKERAGL